MKKNLKLVSFLAIVIFIMLSGTVYAANLNCDLEIKTSKEEYTKGEEFTASVYLSNISSEQGVIALSATLEYDKNSLTLLGMTGQNSWDTPAEGATYNKDNGKIVLTRGQLTKDNEVVFDIKFKVNDNSATSASISLKDIDIANGYENRKTISAVNKSVTVKSADTNQGNNDNQGNNNNNTQNQNVDNGGNTKPDQKYDRTNITNNNPTKPSKNETNKNDTKKDTNTTKENTTNTTNNTSKTNTISNKNTVGSTNTVDNTQKEGNGIPKAGISQFSLWLIIFTAVVFLVALFFYSRLIILDKKNKGLK